MPQEANKLLLWNKKARHRHQPDKAGELAKVAPEGESQCKKPPTGEGQAAFGILWASERPPVFKIRLLIELINTFRLCGASCAIPDRHNLHGRLLIVGPLGRRVASADFCQPLCLFFLVPLCVTQRPAVYFVRQFLRRRFGHSGVAQVVFLAPVVSSFANVDAHANRPP